MKRTYTVVAKDFCSLCPVVKHPKPSKQMILFMYFLQLASIAREYCGFHVSSVYSKIVADHKYKSQKIYILFMWKLLY